MVVSASYDFIVSFVFAMPLHDSVQMYTSFYLNALCLVMTLELSDAKRSNTQFSGSSYGSGQTYKRCSVVRKGPPDVETTSCSAQPHFKRRAYSQMKVWLGKGIIP